EEDDFESLDNSESFKTSEELENERRRGFVRQMGLDAWRAYVKSDWDSGASIISGMSTLWIMAQGEPLGPLQEEFYRGRHWIETKLNRTKIGSKSSQVVTDYVGSLLSLYALTGDQMYLKNAKALF